MSLNNKNRIILKTLLIIIPLFFGLILDPSNTLAKKMKIQKYSHSDQQIKMHQSSVQNLKCDNKFNAQMPCSNINSQNAANSGNNDIMPYSIGSDNNINSINSGDQWHLSGLSKQGIAQDQSSVQNLKCDNKFNAQMPCSNINSQNAVDLGDNLVE
jgi:hypothetical protein